MHYSAHQESLGCVVMQNEAIRAENNRRGLNVVPEDHTECPFAQRGGSKLRTEPVHYPNVRYWRERICRAIPEKIPESICTNFLDSVSGLHRRFRMKR
jgi:hypothetical protein